MTLINIDFTRDGQPADNITGTITAETTDKRVSGLSLIIPAPIVAKIDKGKAVLELSATSKNFAWKLTFKIPGVDAWTDYVLVPNRISINYTELTHVDPETLIKVRTPEPAWYALLTNALQSVAPGPTGPPGKTGERGPEGKRGYTGLRGETGAQGERGLTGERGPTGLQGIQGERGATGPQGNQGERGLTGERGLQGIQGERGLQGLQGIQGVKGDTGIGWNGATLNNVDLNTVVTPGTYYQGSTSQALNPAYNYPAMTDINGLSRGVLEVTTWSGGPSTAIQRYTAIGTGFGGSGAQRPRVTYTRTFQTGGWSSWSAHVTQRVDNTAGRAIYTWDDTNNREQLIYGDTGWRVISSNSGWGSYTLRFRRIGSWVDLILIVASPKMPEGVTSVESQGYALTTDIPQYIRPNLNTYGGGFGRLGSNNQRQPVTVTLTAAGAITLERNEAIGVSGATINSGSSVYLSLSYSVMEPWPTILAGSGSGIIPN